MLALPVALFIYQIIALLAVTALASSLMCNDRLDFRLMHIQNSLDKLKNIKLFKSDTSGKLALFFWTLMALVLTFLPVFLTMTNSIFDYGIYYTDIHTVGQEEAQGGTVPALIPDNETYPIFDRFAHYNPNYAERNISPYFMNIHYVLKTYLRRNLKKQVDPNPSGVWYSSLSDFIENKFLTETPVTKKERLKYPEFSLQKANAITGTYSPQDSNVTTYTFGLQNQDSSTLKFCAGASNNSMTLITNFSSIEGHRIQAIRGTLPSYPVCFPLSDASMPILVQPQNQKLQPSVLDSNDRLFRSRQLSGPTYIINVALSISGMNLNNTHISMGIKKTAHITVNDAYTDYSYLNESLNCSPEELNKEHNQVPLGLSANSIYNHVNHTRIICALRALSQQNPDMPILQASRRVIEQNSSLNSVYTYLAGTPAYPLGGYMVDLTWFTAYTVAAPVTVFPEDNKEYLVAHVRNDDPFFSRSVYESSIESNLENADPYIYAFDLTTRRPLLADLVLVRAALLQRNTYYFTMIKANPRYGVNTEYGWQILISILGCFSFIIWILLGRKMDAKANLRSMLIDTVIVKENITKVYEVATVVNGVSMSVKPSPSRRYFGKGARLGFTEGFSPKLSLLTVDGTPIEARLTE
jgi:hypothetical protein